MQLRIDCNGSEMERLCRNKSGSLHVGYFCETVSFRFSVRLFESSRSSGLKTRFLSSGLHAKASFYQNFLPLGGFR
jgi:hypothetical protein